MTGRRWEGQKVQVRIPPDVLERVDALAARAGTSRAATIRQLLSAATDLAVRPAGVDAPPLGRSHPT